METTNISDLLSTFIDQNQKRDIFNERKIPVLWKEEMGPFINNATQHVDIRDGILKVKITNAALKFELANSRSEIIKRFNDKVGEKIVKDIIFY